MKNLFFLGLIVCFLSSCIEKIDTKALTNTQWELSELPGTTLPTTAKATLNIADSLKIGGKSFCNSYGGQGEIKDNKLALKNIFSTKMFCEGTDAAEHAYLQALNQVDNAKIMDGKLHLFAADKTLLVFTKVN
ncbi:hypothetical protein DHW03_17000 [Pedobacter yonginense]|uniref:DUF306 domain-containing protein n=1 Tax=Pedobacter yonginense TaxID=651869 RepID=A0A317EMH1_9SPHI|nr:META domain-containing protein [Pedobacter yonginense]PWS26476.1 hypothetical protein DHW03_17000 [Pedobacter yonginense]